MVLNSARQLHRNAKQLQLPRDSLQFSSQMEAYVEFGGIPLHAVNGLQGDQGLEAITSMLKKEVPVDDRVDTRASEMTLRAVGSHKAVSLVKCNSLGVPLKRRKFLLFAVSC